MAHDGTLSGTRWATLVDQHVGERIRKRRMLLGFTQEQLAEALNISYQQIQKYETGANRVSAGRLYQIARRLEVEVSHFFDGLGDYEPEGASDGNGDAGAGSSRAIIELVRAFQQIPDQNVRQSLVSLVKNLSNGGGFSANEAANDAQDTARTAEPTGDFGRQQTANGRHGTNGSGSQNGSGGGSLNGL